MAMQPMAMSHTRQALCHNTHIIRYTLQELSRYATAGVKLQTSHISSVFRLEEVSGPVLAFVCVCVCSGVFLPASECVYEQYTDVCAHLPTVIPNKRAHWFMWKNEDLKRRGPGSYHSGGLTLARPPLANSRQQIRSWELPTGLVTAT